MAVPARRDKRRNNLWKISAPSIEKCPQCGEYKESHRLCKTCGYYNGRQVIAVED